MNRIIVLSITVLLSCTIISTSVNADGYGSNPAGGIELSNTSSISIERETINITKALVETTYLFRNYSSWDVSAKIVFPATDYNPLTEAGDWSPPDFSSFTAEVDGEMVEYNIETRAYLNETDCTITLEQTGINISDFRSYQNTIRDYETNFSEEQRNILNESGLVTIVTEGYSDRPFAKPNWITKTRYYWNQMFPANRSIQVKLSYEPNCGGGIIFNAIPEGYFSYKRLLIDDMCMTDEGDTWLNEPGHQAPDVRYVDYILTTANSWRGPIKDFHLIVECEGCWITSCFNGLTRTGPSRLEIHEKNFIPEKDLRVYFF